MRMMISRLDCLAVVLFVSMGTVSVHAEDIDLKKVRTTIQPDGSIQYYTMRHRDNSTENVESITADNQEVAELLAAIKGNSFTVFDKKGNNVGLWVSSSNVKPTVNDSGFTYQDADIPDEYLLDSHTDGAAFKVSSEQGSLAGIWFDADKNLDSDFVNALKPTWGINTRPSEVSFREAATAVTDAIPVILETQDFLRNLSSSMAEHAKVIACNEDATPAEVLVVANIHAAVGGFIAEGGGGISISAKWLSNNLC